MTVFREIVEGTIIIVQRLRNPGVRSIYPIIYYSTSDSNLTDYDTQNEYTTIDDKNEKYDVQDNNKTFHDLGLIMFVLLKISLIMQNVINSFQ